MFGMLQGRDLPGMIGTAQDNNQTMQVVSRIVWAISTISPRTAGRMMSVITTRMEPYVKTITFEIIYSTQYEGVSAAAFTPSCADNEKTKNSALVGCCQCRGTRASIH